MGLLSVIKEAGEKLFGLGNGKAAEPEAPAIAAQSYPLIFEANKPMPKHPDRIYPGQMLRIPPA